MFNLVGTPTQNALIEQALAKCDFPFERLLPKLQAEKNKSTIPVEWADLSAWGAQAAKAADGHDHVHDGDDEAHPITHPEFRNQVLGLAWYSGKVSIDISLEQRPMIAQEVFLAEGAHMVDFFYMIDEHRRAVTAALHNFDETEHGHGWFDVGGYYEWEGEAFMGTFIKAFAPSIPVTIDFVHDVTPEGAQYVRQALLGPRVFSTTTNKYHDSHTGQTPRYWFLSALQARRQGKVPCKVCKP